MISTQNKAKNILNKLKKVNSLAQEDLQQTIPTPPKARRVPSPIVVPPTPKRLGEVKPVARRPSIDDTDSVDVVPRKLAEIGRSGSGVFRQAAEVTLSTGPTVKFLRSGSRDNLLRGNDNFNESTVSKASTVLLEDAPKSLFNASVASRASTVLLEEPPKTLGQIRRSGSGTFSFKSNSAMVGTPTTSNCSTPETPSATSNASATDGVSFEVSGSLTLGRQHSWQNLHRSRSMVAVRQTRLGELKRSGSGVFQVAAQTSLAGTTDAGNAASGLPLQFMQGASPRAIASTPRRGALQRMHSDVSDIMGNMLRKQASLQGTAVV